MRHLLVLAFLMTGPTAIASPVAFELGAHAGAATFDKVRLPAAGWSVAPRAALWLAPELALQFDLTVSSGLSPMPDTRYLAVAPSLWLLADLRPKAPVHPMLSIGAGAVSKQLCGCLTGAVEFHESRREVMAGAGGGIMVPIRGPLRASLEARLVLSGGPPDALWKQMYLSFGATAGLSVRFGDLGR